MKLLTSLGCYLERTLHLVWHEGAKLLYQLRKEPTTHEDFIFFY